MSQCASHAIGDVDVWFFVLVFGNQAHDVQKVVVCRFLRGIPRALQQTCLGGNQG